MWDGYEYLGPEKGQSRQRNAPLPPPQPIP